MSLKTSVILDIQRELLIASVVSNTFVSFKNVKNVHLLELFKTSSKEKVYFLTQSSTMVR